jgi:hypothetical protein
LSDQWVTFLEKLLIIIPGTLAALGLGYKMGQKGKKGTEVELMKTQLELERANNEKKVTKKFDGMSDDDILDAELKRGGKSEA